MLKLHTLSLVVYLGKKLLYQVVEKYIKNKGKSQASDCFLGVYEASKAGNT